MLTKKQIKLAILNGKENEIYEQEIISKVRNKYISSNDELAILRKEVALLRKILTEQLGIEIGESEFDTYNNYVEGSKANTKAYINEIKK